MAAKKTVTPATETKETTKVELDKVVEKEVKEKKAPAKKVAEKKEPAKKETAKKTTAKKAELKSSLNVQFDGKSYSEEDLMKIAKDVWEYDLKQNAGDLTNVELYVKPEESLVYYVMNGEFTGSFSI